MPVASLIRTLQDAPAPDFIVRPAIAAMVSAARRRLPTDPGVEGRFAEDMTRKIIAEHVEAAPSTTNSRLNSFASASGPG